MALLSLGGYLDEMESGYKKLELKKKCIHTTVICHDHVLPIFKS